MSLLTLQNLSKSFGGLRAVDDVGFTVVEGAIKAVIGPNGAGKSTLFNLVFGATVPDKGSVEFAGTRLPGGRPHRSVFAGMARTFQHIQLFPQMTALENVMVGRHTRSRAGFLSSLLPLPWTRREERNIREEALASMRFLGIEALAQSDATHLAYGEQRSVELARALASKPKLLLLDEPAAGLNMRETVDLGKLIRRIRDSGVTVLLVEHDMGLVMGISDEIVVLCQGQKIAEDKPLAIQKNPEVVRAYLGDEELSLRNVESGYGSLKVLRHVSLHVGRGEIVSIIGANGAGKTTLLKTIVGLLHARDGQILFEDRDIRGARTESIVRAGCSLVPEGRQVFAPMSVHENLLLGASARFRRGVRVNTDDDLNRVFALFPRLKERIDQLAGTLSGGEQQMLALGRALMARPKLILLDEPSMGLAPLVVKEIFVVIRRLRDEGSTVLLVEQNARAALKIANRGYVLENGRIILEAPAEALLANRDVERAYLGRDLDAEADMDTGR